MRTGEAENSLMTTVYKDKQEGFRESFVVVDVGKSLADPPHNPGERVRNHLIAPLQVHGGLGHSTLSFLHEAQGTEDSRHWRYPVQARTGRLVIAHLAATIGRHQGAQHKIHSVKKVSVRIEDATRSPEDAPIPCRLRNMRP